MEYDFSSMSDEELDKALASAQTPAPAAPQGGFDVSAMSDEELNAALASAGGEAPRMTREERIAQNQRAIERAQQPGDGEDGFDLAVLEGVKGAARAVKSIGGGIVGMVSGAARLAGTPVRLATGWEGLHRLADTIDSSYENFGRDALMSEYGENPDGWGYALGRAGEKVAGVAGSLAALGGVGKAVGAAGTVLKAAGHAKTAAVVANTLPLMFGNDAAVRAYDTARASGKSRGEAAALAGLNGAIHFFGFKAFENQSLKKMLNIGPEVEVMMPKWAGEMADAGGQSFSSLVRGTRNGMIKYIAAENGKRALKAGGIMGLQDMLSDPVMQVAEGAGVDDIDFSRMLKAGAHGVGEGALMEGLMGGAAILRSQKAAEKFMSDKYFRGKDYKVVGPDGKMHDEPGLLNTSEGRMVLMKQNPDATERVLDIVEHGGMPRPAELDAAFLPPDMTAEELRKFASDWRKDLQPYVDEAWNADQPTRPAPPVETAAEAPRREFLSAEEAAEQRGDAQAAIGQPPKQETSDETGNGAAEAPAQPEQAEVVAPPAGAEARPVESAEAPAEAAAARVVEPPAQPVETAQKPAEAAAEPRVGEDTPKPAEGAEAASRASDTTEQGQTTEPIAEKKSEAEAKPGAMSPTQKRNRLAKVQGILNRIDPDIAIDTKALRYGQNNPNGLKLGDLKMLDDPANEGWQYELGLPKERADELRNAVRTAYEEQRAASPNRKDKANESGQDTYSVSASKALERLAAKPNDLKRLGVAHEQVSAAMEAAKRQGDEQGAKFWEDRLTALNGQIEKLEPNDQAKVAAAVQDMQSEKSAMERKGTQSLETGEGKTLDVAASEEDVAQTNSIKGGGGKGGSLVGNRHLRIDNIDGDTLTVKAMDAAGKPLSSKFFPNIRKDGSVKMTRAQWEMLGKAAKINDGIDGDPANPQKGDLIRMAKSDAADLPDAWTPETQKPLERVANALRNVVTAGGKRIKVLFVPRPKNADGDTRKSIGGIFTGTAADYANRSRRGGVDDGPSLKKIGTGEGSQVYGWGLYGSNVQGVADRYAKNGRGAGGKDWIKEGRNHDELSDVEKEAASYLKGMGSKEGAIERLKEDIEWFEKQGIKEEAEALKPIVEELSAHGDEYREQHENIYEQTFFTDRAPGDESHLLKWYEPVSEEQLGWVRNAAEKEGVLDDRFKKFLDVAEKRINGEVGDKANGESLYLHAEWALGSPKAASEFLARAGIDGVKYPVDSYGGKGVKDGDEAGWNYVSFRDDNIRVDHKWEDGNFRYMKNAKGETVGEYDAAKGEIRLYPGARVADVVHEFTHPLVDYARAEAKAGRGEFLNKIKEIIDAERETWEQPVRDAYKGKGEEEILEEIFTHAMGEKGEKLFGKSTNTLQGRQWYKQLWEKIKGLWQDFATKMGWNKADLRGLDRMSPEEAARHILSEMAKGRSFGDAKTGGEGTRNVIADSLPAEGQGGVRESRRVVLPKPPGARIMDDERSAKEKFEEKFIDARAPIRNVQDEVGGVKEVFDPKTGYTDHKKSTDYVAAADKANGRVEYELRDLQHKSDDISRDLAKAALKGQSSAELEADFDLYLQCRHAAERNRTIAERNGVTYDPDYYYGMGKVDRGGTKVGLSENVANDILADMARKYGSLDAFDKAAQKVYEINRADIQRRVEAGRLTVQDANQYLYRWQNYVPLKTDMERLEPDAFNSSTASMRRNEFRKARGRADADIADSPLAASILQAEQGIRGSVKNETLNVLANLVRHAEAEGKPIAEIVEGKDMPQGAGWTFEFGDGSRAVAGGEMKLAGNHPEIILFKEDGKLKAIRFEKGANGRGLAVAKSASGENMGRWGGGTEWIPRFTHWMSAMRTQYSPEFTVSNLLADHLEAYQALVGRYGIKGGTAAFGKMVASEIQNAKDLKNYLKTGMMSRDVGEAIRGGLLTKGGVASEGFEGKEQGIRDRIENFRRKERKWRDMSAADWAKSGWDNVRDFISFANEMAEYSTRMGIFSALKKQGVPVKDAVKFARDATVNFNRKGTAMPYINGLFMFANASVQGAVRSVQAMTDARGKELVGLLVGVGVAKAVIDNYLGNDDEREKKGGRNARNLSEYDRKHNVGVPVPGTDMQFVPLRFRGPYAAVPYLAQTAANVALGERTPRQGADALLRELGDQVTDIVGGNGIMNDKGEFDSSLIFQSLAPSMMDPVVQWVSGKDYKGEDRLAKSFDKTMPASSNGKRSTAWPYKLIAKGINAIPWLSGGNENRIGRLDIAPENVQLITEFLGAGPARDVGNLFSTVGNVIEKAKGGSPEKTWSQVPFVRRVVKEYPENTSRYYDALDAYERDKAEFKKTTDLKRRAEFGREHPYVRPMPDSTKSRVDMLAERIKELTHLERGEVKAGQKWVERRTPPTESQKETFRKRRLELQAKVLGILGE